MQSTRRTSTSSLPRIVAPPAFLSGVVAAPRPGTVDESKTRRQFSVLSLVSPEYPVLTPHLTPASRPIKPKRPRAIFCLCRSRGGRGALQSSQEVVCPRPCTAPLAAALLAARRTLTPSSVPAQVSLLVSCPTKQHTAARPKLLGCQSAGRSEQNRENSSGESEWVRADTRSARSHRLRTGVTLLRGELLRDSISTHA